MEVSGIGNKHMEFCKPAQDGFRVVEQFEKEFAYALGIKHCIAVNSGYTALFMALKAIGVKEGDEVIVPDFTMIATANAVEMCGAKPVFVDCEYETGNIEVGKIREKLTTKTKAIIPVHIYGHPAEMDEIKKLAEESDIWVIEDAAEAHGALYKDQMAGTIGDMGCFSFYHNKIISTGEGGAIVTNNDALAEELRGLRSYKFERGYLHKGFGWSFRMNPYGAIEGLRNIKNFNKLIERRRQIADYYDEHLTDWVVKPVERSYVQSVYWMYGIKVGSHKMALQEHLAKRDVPTRDFFLPMRGQPMYLDIGDSVAWRIHREGLLLPSMPTLDEGELKKVVDAINEFAE